MFTDTKNFAIGSSALDVSFTKPCDSKSKKKLHKIWKPLVRLVTLKSTTKKTTSSNCTTSHPNNVNLNNISDSKNILLDKCHEHNVAIPRSHKVVIPAEVDEEANELHYNHKCQMENRETTTGIISSVNIDKTSIKICNSCAYGRNCYCNELGHYEKYNSLSVIEELASDYDVLNQLPIQYIRTDDGTFFWTSAQNKSDDDLLSAWLCNRVQQFPVQAQAVLTPLH